MNDVIVRWTNDSLSLTGWGWVLILWVVAHAWAVTRYRKGP